MNHKLITKSQNSKKSFFQNIIAKRYLAICLNKICTNLIAKMAKLFFIWLNYIYICMIWKMIKNFDHYYIKNDLISFFNHIKNYIK